LGAIAAVVAAAHAAESTESTSAAPSALDLFSGTTRVAQEFKRQGFVVTACDLASYSEVLAQCYIATDAASIDQAELAAILQELNALPPQDGYFTQTFCRDSRYFQPKNGQRIEAIRAAIEADYKGHPYYSILLTAVMLAADRVDSTVGLQMAYLKDWSKRSHNDLQLLLPQLIAGTGHALRGDAQQLAATLGHFDLAYLDPPYNQHRYFTNYHVWETLIRYDQPAHYGKACKRIDARDDHTKSPFNSKPLMAAALQQVIADLSASTMVVSHNNESWVSAADIEQWLQAKDYESVQTFDFDFKRYIGAQIGIHDPKGAKVGQVSHVRNIEHIIVAGKKRVVQQIERALTNCSSSERIQTSKVNASAVRESDACI